MGDLHRVCGQLDAAAAALVQSGWSGKFVVLTLLEQAKQPIAAMYNHNEAAFLEQLAAKARKRGWESHKERGPGESSSSEPGSAPGSPER